MQNHLILTYFTHFDTTHFFYKYYINIYRKNGLYQNASIYRKNGLYQNESIYRKNGLYQNV